MLVNLERIMSIESAIEQKIKEAMARGEFDNLPGMGKPINLDDYFNTPEDVRMGYSVLKSNNFVPEEVELLNQIAELRRQLQDCTDKAEHLRLTKSISEKSLSLSLLLEKSKKRR